MAGVRKIREINLQDAKTYNFLIQNLLERLWSYYFAPKGFLSRGEEGKNRALNAIVYITSLGLVDSDSPPKDMEDKYIKLLVVISALFKSKGPETTKLLAMALVPLGGSILDHDNMIDSQLNVKLANADKQVNELLVKLKKSPDPAVLKAVQVSDRNRSIAELSGYSKQKGQIRSLVSTESIQAAYLLKLDKIGAEEEKKAPDDQKSVPMMKMSRGQDDSDT